MSITNPDDAGSVLGDLGLGDSFLPDELSPPVNRAVLDRLVRGDLDGEAVDAARRLVARFRPWRRAYTHALLGQFQGIQGQGGSGSTWLLMPLAWQQLEERTAAVWAALFMLLAGRQLATCLALGRTRSGDADHAKEKEVTLAEVQAHFATGAPLTVSAPEHWLCCTVSGDRVQVEARRDPIEPLPSFRIEFRRGGQPVVSLKEENGVVTLTHAHFLAAEQGHADEICIVVDEPHAPTGE